MKRFLTILVISCLSANMVFCTKLIFEYEFEKPVILNNKIYLPGCTMSQDPFYPSIPVKPVTLLLPYCEKAVSVSIIPYDHIILEGQYDIDPVSPSGRYSVPPPTPYIIKSDIYLTNQYYPEDIKNISWTTHYKNGHSLFIASLYPVQYNPVQKTVSYYKKIKIIVNTDEVDRSGMYRTNAQTRKHLAALSDNPEMLYNYPEQKEFNENDYEYLIITSSAFEQYFDPFISFNMRRGMRTKVSLINDILNETTGDDDQDKIRNYILQQYQDHGIIYVLLGGDEEIIPERGMRAEIMDYGTDYYDDTDIAADMYYSCLDGTWQNTGSSYFGEPGSEDLLWEVYTARFCVDSQTELQNLMNKTIDYSETPVNSGITNNLLLGEFLWSEDQGDGFIDTWGKFCMDQFIGECDSNGFYTTGFDNLWNSYTLYDYDFNWHGSDLLQSVSDNDIVWIDHLGHSYVTYNMKMDNNDIVSSNFSNDGTNANYFIVYSQGCYSGSFDNRYADGSTDDEDCIGEKFVTISNAAVAYIGNSRYGLGSPYDTDGSGQRFHRFFHHAVFEEGIHSIEQMNAYSKEVNASQILDQDIYNPPYYGQCRWIAYNMNVLGDPALSIWTKEPMTLTPDVPDIIYSSFLLTTEPFSRLALVSDAGEFLYCGMTDENGECLVSSTLLSDYIELHTDDSLNLYIKADNYLPYYKRIHIIYLGVEDVSGNTYINICPNPNKGNFSVRFFNMKGDLNILITDTKGRSVLNKKIYNTRSDHTEQIDISNASAGVYILRITNYNTVITKKIVVY